jgi:excisionase family DNA binding protein
MKQRQQLTHNDLPQAVEALDEKVEKILAFMTVRDEKDFESRQSDIIDIKELSKILNITTSGLYQKVHSKSIPFFKLKDSNRVRFSRKQINAWLMESQRQAA